MKEFIEKWLKNGLINAQQSKQMLADIEKDSSEKSSKKIIFAFSIIGSVLAGTGAVLFIAANWQFIPAIVKIISLASVTFAAAYAGYYLEYEKNYPKTGSSLLFLSTLLFGALIFLTAQTYHIESSGRLHLLILIWLISIVPYIYLFKSKAVAVLSMVLLFTWLSAFAMKHSGFNYEHSLPLIFCCAAIFTFAIGKLHDFITGYEELAPVFEKISIFIIFFCLFLMTFGYFSKPPLHISVFFSGSIFAAAANSALLIVPVFILLSSFVFNPAKLKANHAEIILMLCIFSYCLLIGNPYLSERIFHGGYESSEYYYGYSSVGMLRIFTNLFFALSVLGLILSGYMRKRMFYVNLGIFWLVIFITFKYFDIFWRLMPRSLFFLIGGVLLIGSALFFEHKRREIKTEFTRSE